jgi:hypothetical protein
MISLEYLFDVFVLVVVFFHTCAWNNMGAKFKHIEAFPIEAKVVFCFFVWFYIKN